MLTKSEIDQLPSLPQVLLQLLDAINNQSADFKHIADIVRKDTATSTRLLTIANSSFYRQSQEVTTIERALMVLGIDTVKTIVITAGMNQFYQGFGQDNNELLKMLWHRSLVSAQLAQVLASLTSYSSPDEAYLCGLLTDIGQLVLLTREPDRYIAMVKSCETPAELLAQEHEAFSITHTEIASQLVDSWSIDGFMPDAVLYHHESHQAVQDSHHLVKIINLAVELSESDLTDQALSKAYGLFGLTEALTKELQTRAQSDIRSLAAKMGFSIDDADKTASIRAQQALGQRLSQLAGVAQLLPNYHSVSSLDDALMTCQRALYLALGVNKSLIFIYNAEKQTLISHNGDFSIPAVAQRSLIADAFLSNSTCYKPDGDTPLTIVDRQILRFCRTTMLVCQPLRQNKEPVGVLVLGASPEQIVDMRKRELLLQTLSEECGKILHHQQNKESGQDKAKEHYQKIIGEAVHEAGNPLSVIQNYLEVLRLKAAQNDSTSVDEEIVLIKDEIERVGEILIRLRNPRDIEDPSTDENVDINQIVGDITELFQNSLAAAKGVTISCKLDPKIGTRKINTTQLKQVLTNLLKNAIEALPAEGKIKIRTDNSINMGSRKYLGISIEDNGPGLPEEIKKELFSASKTTKGGSHSGLGLRITKRLVDELQGTIFCRSDENQGTHFQLLFP